MPLLRSPSLMDSLYASYAGARRIVVSYAPFFFRTVLPFALQPPEVSFRYARRPIAGYSE